ncbi:MAG: uroporphyrinogen-III synthase [Cellvibrionaceae bacterium]|nr:uroporphyrinogen-III synthase [Cellvibrionaceae bacterium]
MSGQLSGLHLLLTRPQAQATHWAPLLQKLGAQVSLLPMMVIEAVSHQRDKQAIINRILRLDDYQSVIFVSQNAVYFGAQWIDAYWPQLPLGLQFFAVGEATAKQLQETLGPMGATIVSPQMAMNSEALLALDALKTIAQQKIAIFRGRGGRPYLGEQLHARGAQVDYIELYYRRRPPSIDRQILAHFKATSAQAITVVHSGETLENLCQSLNPADVGWLQQHPLLVPGARVAQQAQNKGFSTIIRAVNATHPSMIEALYDWRQQHSA